MGRIEDLQAAVAKDEEYVGVYEGVPDPSKTPTQWENLAKDQRTLVKNVTELNALLVAKVAATVINEPVAPVVAPVGPPAGDPPFDAFSADPKDTTPYIVGGTAAGNPNGITWTNADAIGWFEHVWANNVGYHAVRPTLLPGSHVLSPSGLAYARAFEQQAGLTEAPEDFNPLGLTVVA